MDVLSDLLRSIHLSGGVYFRCDFSAPWGMEITPTSVAEFHVIVSGSCWLRMRDRPDPILLQSGDVVTFPRGDGHTLLDAPKGTAVPAEQILRGKDLTHYGPVKYGGKGAPASVLCGYFQFDRERQHPLLAALPSLIHIRGTDSYDLAWLQAVLNFITHETRSPRAGTEAIVNRLVEVLFVQIVRAHIESSPALSGILAALGDRQITAALRLMHETPQDRWTLAQLARRIGMSRSGLAARFNELVEQTPMQYLASWRMHKARELLAEAGLSIAAVAERVGYQSEAAFSKAFKKATGARPGAYRRNAVPARRDA